MSAEQKAYDLPPPGAPLWWVSSPIVTDWPAPTGPKHPEWIPESTCHVFTRTWFDARAQICSTLGVCQDAIVVTLGNQERTERGADA